MGTQDQENCWLIGRGAPHCRRNPGRIHGSGAWCQAERDEELLLALVREQRVDYEMRRLLLQRMRTVNPQAAL